MTTSTEIAGHILTWAGVLKQLSSLAKSVKDLGSKSISKEEAAMMTQNILDLQGTIMGLQNEHLELSAVKCELEAKIAEYDRWNEEQKNYRLKEIEPGLSVFVFQKCAESEEDDHWLCPGCFSNRKKGIFVMTTKPGMMDKVFKCSLCKFEIRPHGTPGRKRV